MYLWAGALVSIAFLALIRKWGDYIKGIDAVFAHGEPRMSTVIHTIMPLKTRLSAEKLRRIIEERMFAYKRFRQRLVRRDWLWSFWQEDPNLHVDNHLIVKTLPGAGDQPELEKLVSSLIITPLDERHPLWQFYLIEDYNGGSVIVFRIHHCMGDGVGLLRCALTITNFVDGTKQKQLDTARSTAQTEADAVSIAKPAAAAAATTAKGGAVEAKAKRPNLTAFQIFVSGLKATVKLLLLPSDAVSLLKASTPIPAGEPIHARWTRTKIPLDFVKKVAKKNGVSVNDVMLSSASGAIRTYLHQTHQQAVGSAVQAVMWVSLRGLDLDKPFTPDQFCNSIGACYMKLPLHIPDASARLTDVQHQTKALTTSPEPYIAAFIMTLFGLLPQRILAPTWAALAFKTTLSLSNLPGPQNGIHFAGAELDNMIFFVPPTRTIGHFMTILSYNGFCTFGCASDSRIIPEPLRLVECFESEIRDLAKMSGVESY